jgi:nucleoside-diphosphate-sugar epimerase
MYLPMDCSKQAGFVGGWIVLHLLQRGEDPSRIRVLDIRLPTRPDLTSGPARDVQFLEVDISDAAAVERAFKSPWPTRNGKELANPQVTVFHTAANIRFYERHPSLVPISSKVNVDGTKNVIDAARSIGVSILVFTSSGSVAIRNSRFWLWPWEKEPKYFVQVMNDDEGLTQKPLDGFFSNYARTKIVAERLVRAADRSPSGDSVLRTGCLRPGGGVFGPGGDLSLGAYLVRKINPSWITTTMQSFTYVENCSIAHLLYEQRLLEISQGRSKVDIGGQAFVIADPGPPPISGDAQITLATLTNGETRFPELSPTVLLLIAHIVEFFSLARHFLVRSVPFIASWIPTIPADIVVLQPSLFRLTTVHTIFDDSRARLPPEKGGLGYKGICTTLEGAHLTVDAFKKSSGKAEDRSTTAGINVSFAFGGKKEN